MDVVNKWLTLIGVMGAILIITVGWKAGSGKYAIYVTDAPYEDYQMVYTVNTRSGEVKGKMHHLGEHFTKDGQVRDYAVKVIKKEDPNQYSYRYNYKDKPVRKVY